MFELDPFFEVIDAFATQNVPLDNWYAAKHGAYTTILRDALMTLEPEERDRFIKQWTRALKNYAPA